MLARLDQQSQSAISRFGFKICFSLFIALLGKIEYVPATATWLALYALFTLVIATLLRQRLPPASFNHWDEAMWLACTSAGLMAADELLSP